MSCKTGSKHSLFITFMLAAMVFSAAFISGCKKQGEDSSASKTPSKPVALRIGSVGHDHQLALYVAAMLDKQLPGNNGIYFHQIREREVYELVKDGLPIAELQFIKLGGGSGIPAALSRDEIDIGLGGIMPIAKMVDQGADIKVIAPLQTDGDMLVMQKHFDCESWAEFCEIVRQSPKPLRIGYKAPMAIAKLIFERALEAESIKHSLDESDADAKIILVNMNSEGGWAALMEKAAIDGFVMNQPAPAVTQYKGLGKIVCDLSDLPPAGAWVGHPCCCVAATGKTIENHPEIVRAFIEVLHTATHAIIDDQQMAINAAAQWTGNSIEIERNSVPTITYTCKPDKAWFGGMKIWLAMMDDLDFFKGKFADASADEILAELCDLRFSAAAVSADRD